MEAQPQHEICEIRYEIKKKNRTHMLCNTQIRNDAQYTVTVNINYSGMILKHQMV